MFTYENKVYISSEFITPAIILANIIRYTILLTKAYTSAIFKASE
jgi:hypothetical protein